MSDVFVDRVNKSFGEVRALRDVSLAVRDGEFMTLLGPSGCGKSTLLRIVAGLEAQSGGSVSIGGENVDHRVPKQRDVAMVFQSYALYPYMTVYENMALPLVMRRMTAAQRLPLVGRFVPGSAALRSDIEASVREVAASLAIEGLLGRKPAHLSGGQRQRAALGRAMVRNPKVFLMDEPLSNLDAKLRTQMRTELADLHRRLHATFIYVTHDQSEAMTMSDRVAVMMDGEVLQIATPTALYNDPADLRVAEFVGSPRINVVPGIVASEGGVRALDGHVCVAAEAAVGSRVDLGMRSECLTLRDADAAATFRGRTKHVENLGSDCFVHVAVDGLEAPIVARADGRRAGDFAIGAGIGVACDPERVLLFDKAGKRVTVRQSAARVRTHG
ncbi:MAG: ABC transporter ATP-binding protein [Burkholderiales bacterium]|nr:ABC transporter ATP-binding protein [Burkholderiales bacterium]